MWNDSDIVRCVGFDATKNDWSGDCEDYIQSAAAAVVPGALCALVLLLTIVIYVLAQCCGLLRCICRGCKLSDEGARPEAVRLHHGLVWAVVLLLVALAALSTASNDTLRTAMNDLRDDMCNVEMQTQVASDDMLDAVTAFVISGARTARWGHSTLIAALSAHDEVGRWTRSIHNVQSNLTRYLWAIDAVVWFVALVLLGFAATTLLNVHRVVPSLTLFLIVVVGSCVMLLQGTSGVAADFVDSTCSDRDAVVNSVNSFFAAPRFQDNVAVVTLATLPLSIDSTYTSTMCSDPKSEVSILCSTGLFTCPTNCSSAEGVASFLAATALTYEPARGNCTGQCTILECAEQCEEGSSEQTTSAVVAKVVRTYHTARAATDATATQIAGATLFTSGVSTAMADVCAGDMSSAFGKLSRMLSAASALIAAAAVLVGLGSFIFYGSSSSEERQTIVVANAWPVDYGEPIEADLAARAHAKEAEL